MTTNKRSRSDENIALLPLCSDYKLSDTSNEDSHLIIRKIIFKKNDTKVIKDVLNNPRNRMLIQSKLSTTDVKSEYKINSTEILHSWLKLIMLHHLKHHVFTRLANGEYGVRIKAVKDIPAGTVVFQTTASNCVKYEPVTLTIAQVNNADIDQGTKDILDDFYLSITENASEISYPIPLLSPNVIDQSFFLNHDCHGNIEIIDKDDCDMSSYVSKRIIPKDSTLTINYAEFTKSKDGYNRLKLLNLLNRMPFLKNLSPFKDNLNIIINSDAKIISLNC